MKRGSNIWYQVFFITEQNYIIEDSSSFSTWEEAQKQVSALYRQRQEYKHSGIFVFERVAKHNFEVGMFLPSRQGTTLFFLKNNRLEECLVGSPEFIEWMNS